MKLQFFRLLIRIETGYHGIFEIHWGRTSSYTCGFNRRLRRFHFPIDVVFAGITLFGTWIGFYWRTK